MSQEMFAPTPIVTQATTPPPKVIDVKFSVALGNPNDLDHTDFDFINLEFVYDSIDAGQRSPASIFMVDTRDIDTNIKDSYIQKADDYPYQYWQRSAEYNFIGEIIDEPIPGGIKNSRITITPINDNASGNRSTFLLPFKNLQFIPKSGIIQNPTNMILAKYWHLFSLTPEIVFNRPKVMHIYLNVDEGDVLMDKERRSDPYYRHNCIGDWVDTNQEMFRWIVGEDYYYKLDADDIFQDMTSEEITFIKELLKSFNNIQMKYLSDNRIGLNDPYIFKIAVENPRDHQDSIIIYIMKETLWEL